MCLLGVNYGITYMFSKLFKKFQTLTDASIQKIRCTMR